jgi:hypothetical protein
LDGFGNLVVEVPDNEVFTSAELTATLSATTFARAGGGVFTASSTAIDTLLLPSSGPNLIAGADLALIEASGSISTPPVPEPRARSFSRSWPCAMALTKV